jgi:predicted nucleotide-binding protein
MHEASITYDRVVFPVSFYLGLIERIKDDTRSMLLATMGERREGARRSADERGETIDLDGLGYLWNADNINHEVSTLYRTGIPVGTVGSVTSQNVTWRFDTLEEVFRELRKPFDRAEFGLRASLYGVGNLPALSVSVSNFGTSVTISADTRDRVQLLIDLFNDSAPDFTLPPPEPERPRIFLGHGGDSAWQTTERWLSQMGFEVRAYETLPHSGRTIERVLEDALDWANFALLVMTSEDQMADETAQARQNVVHELGLFQGRLGWEHAIVMLEADANEFSNIAGTNQLRFPVGDISAKHGDIMIALKERFPGLTF